MKLQDIITKNFVLTETQISLDLELVKQIQTRLAVLNFYPDNQIDGESGVKTKYGIQKFCESEHLNNAITGSYGASFAKALINAKCETCTPEIILNIAKAEIGYKESGNNRNKFGQWYGMDAQPWCAMFVSHCFHKAGTPLKITTPLGFAYCPYGVAWFKQQGRWHKSPKVGDIVFFDWGRDGVSDHVGFVSPVK